MFETCENTRAYRIFDRPKFEPKNRGENGRPIFFSGVDSISLSRNPMTETVSLLNLTPRISNSLAGSESRTGACGVIRLRNKPEEWDNDQVWHMQQGEKNVRLLGCGAGKKWGRGGAAKGGERRKPPEEASVKRRALAYWGTPGLEIGGATRGKCLR